jgi:hypothetical protein
MQWFRAAVKAGNALASAIEQRNNIRFQEAQQMANALHDLRNEIVSPDMDAWCLDDSVLEDPITADEYEEMIRVRKSNDNPPRDSEAWIRWTTLVSRHWFQFPSSLEQDMWHEAGHIVVGHKLGWEVQRIDRQPDGTPIAEIPPPCAPPELSILDFSTVAVAGYLAEDKQFGNALPTKDHINVAHQFRASEARQGRAASPASTLARVLEAEARAQTILDENWDAVSRVAALATAGLPVRRSVLLRELRDIEQLEPNCGSIPERAAAKPQRQHSLITRSPVQRSTRTN